MTPATTNRIVPMATPIPDTETRRFPSNSAPEKNAAAPISAMTETTMPMMIPSMMYATSRAPWGANSTPGAGPAATSGLCQATAGGGAAGGGAAAGGAAAGGGWGLVAIGGESGGVAATGGTS
jgi:hypothetical protein